MLVENMENNKEYQKEYKNEIINDLKKMNRMDLIKKLYP